MQDLTVTLIQSSLHWEAPEANLDQFTQKLSSIDKETDLVILPEMFTTGFSMNADKMSESMDGPTVKWMEKMAKQLDAVVTGSIIINEKGKYYNRLIWMPPDGHLQFYNKRHLFTMANEQLTYTAGERLLMVEYKGWKICPLICYDLRFPVWSRNDWSYDLLFYVANWPSVRNFAWKRLLQARAIENQSWTIGVNRVGKDGNGWDFSGDSCVFDALGEKPVYMKAEEEDIFTISLSSERTLSVRTKMPFLDDQDQFRIF